MSTMIHRKLNNGSPVRLHFTTNPTDDFHKQVIHFLRSNAPWETSMVDMRISFFRQGEMVTIHDDQNNDILATGLINSSPHGAHWIGLVVSSILLRRQGLAKLVMHELISIFHKRSKSPEDALQLLASPLGATLYPSLGFVHVPHLSTDFLKAVSAAPTSGDPSQASRRATSEKDIDDAFRFLQDVLRKPPHDTRLTLDHGGHCHILRDNATDQVVAAAWGRPYQSVDDQTGVFVGPLVADSDSLARTLLHSLISRAPVATMLGVSVEGVRSAADTFTDVGFKRVADVRYMAYRPPRNARLDLAHADTRRCFAVLSFDAI